MTAQNWITLAVAIAGIISPGLRPILAALTRSKPAGK